jgi:uridylate kinase
MGIDVSRLNGRLLIAALGDQAHHAVPEDLEQVSTAAASGKIVVTGGLHPGQSTNATAALIAEKVKASKFLNATDVDGIYDSDPNKNRNAKLFSEITVKKCLQILGSENSIAGTYDLMDIVALKVIERSKIPTVVLKSDVATVRNAIGGKATGTRIVF